MSVRYRQRIQRTCKKKLYLISALILLIGLGSAVVISLTTENDAKNVMGYEIVGGKAYLNTPENSKKYVHDLKQVRGKAAVYADEFNRWFTGLWHGTSLTFAIAGIAIIVSLGFYLAAKTTPPDSEPDSPHDHDQSGRT